MAHPVFGPLAEHHQALIDIIGEPRSGRGRWPTFDYIERTYRQRTGEDALQTFSLLPTVKRPVGGSDIYHMLYSEGNSWRQKDERHCLTIAGMSPFSRLASEAQSLVNIIAFITRMDAELEPGPDNVVELRVTLDQLVDRMGPSAGSRGWSARGRRVPWR